MGREKINKSQFGTGARRWFKGYRARVSWPWKSRSGVLTWMLGGFALAPMAAYAVDLGPCETCQCLTEAGHLIFDVGNEGKAVPDWKKRLPHCNSATTDPTGRDHFFTSFFPKMMERYSRQISHETNDTHQALRKICLTQWLSFIDPIRDLDQKKLECITSEKAPVPGMGQRILRRCEEDQASLKVVISYNGGKTSNRDDACPRTPTMAVDVAVLVRLDNNDFIRNEGILDRLKKILKGDPGAALPAWLIVQHADQDRDLQRRALPRFKELLKEGLVEPKRVAWLADRNMIADEHHQLYGSHTTCKDESAVFEPPLDDPILADQRRAKLGLPPAQDLLDRRSRENCGVR